MQSGFEARYLNYFRVPENVACYMRFREVVDHEQRCVPAISRTLQRYNGNRPARVLDIGAGSGAITRMLLNQLETRPEVTVIEPATTLAESAASELAAWKPTIHQTGLREALPNLSIEFDLVTAIHSTYAFGSDITEALPSLLSRDGLLVLWTSARANNVLSDICVALGQDGRLFAEELVVQLASADPDYRVIAEEAHEWTIPSLVNCRGHWNARGHSVVTFLSLGELVAPTTVPDRALIAARQAAMSAGHPIRELLIVIGRATQLTTHGR